MLMFVHELSQQPIKDSASKRDSLTDDLIDLNDKGNAHIIFP